MSKEVIVITGSRGSGKSTTAALFAPPSEISKVCYIDTEDSASDLVKKLCELKHGFGEYVRMYERLKVKEDLLDLISRGKLPWVNEQQKSALVDYYLFFLNKMNTMLKPGKFKYLIIDTVEPLEAGLAAWAETHRKESGWSGQRDHGKLEVEAVRPLYDAMLESFSLRGIEYILLTSHLKSSWLNDKPVPGKVEPGGRLSLLTKLSSIMLWMSPQDNNASGAPAAIVLKARRAKIDIEGDKWVVRKSLPQRVPEFSWDRFRQYERDGCDRLCPQPGESITTAERAMISEFLTDEQMKLMVLGAETELEMMKSQQMPAMGGGEWSMDDNGRGVIEQASNLTPDVVSKITQLSQEGLKPMQIRGQIEGVTLKDIMEVINRSA